MDNLSPHFEALSKRLAESPLSVRIYGGLSMLAVVVWGVIGSGPTSSGITSLLNLAVVAAVLNGSFTGWGLGVMLAIGGILLGATGPAGGIVLVVYGIVAFPLLLAPSTRRWAGATRR